MPKKITTTITKAQELNVFNVNVSPALISQAIYVYQANSHRGVSKVKSRSEVTATSKKVYKQKGTGGARHGSKSAPTYVGGGVVFGPLGLGTPLKSFNKKMKLKALAGILNLYQTENRLSLINTSGLKSISTKEAAKFLPEDYSKETFAVVHFNEEKDVLKSLGNLSGVDLLSANRLNVLKVAQHAKVVLTQNAVDHLVKRLEKVSSIKKSK